MIFLDENLEFSEELWKLNQRMIKHEKVMFEECLRRNFQKHQGTLGSRRISIPW